MSARVASVWVCSTKAHLVLRASDWPRGQYCKVDLGNRAWCQGILWPAPEDVQSLWRLTGDGSALVRYARDQGIIHPQGRMISR